MTVTTIPAPRGGTESSSKLLNSNSKTDIPTGGISFNAAMHETASNFKFDDQHYMLSDGQVLSAEQLLEMLENGNSLPGMNLPSLAELQHYKLKAGSYNQQFQPVVNAGVLTSGPINPDLINKSVQASDKFLQFDPTPKVFNQTFELSGQQVLQPLFNQNQLLKAGVLPQEHFLVAVSATTTANTTNNTSPEILGNGFNTAYGYQSVAGPNGTSVLMSNSFNISTPVQHPQWNQSLGQSVQWMVSQNIQQAEIKLNPPDLGLLDIRLSMNNDQASVTFAAPNAAVRDALEAAMPKLREMLEESGISLADVNVSEHSLDHGKEQQDSEMTGVGVDGMANGENDSESQGSINPTTIKAQLGLLDTYA